MRTFSIAAAMKICALLVPREMKLEHSGGVKAMTTEQLERGIEIIKELIAKTVTMHCRRWQPILCNASPRPQKWRKMAKLNRRPRWRGPALGGRLQRGVRFCFSAHDGEATTPTLTEWARPEIVHAGRRPTATQMVNQARALRSIGAKKVRRAGNGWVWRLSDNEAE